MRARLYRGPHNGKVFNVPDHQRSIMLTRRAKPMSFAEFTGNIGPDTITIPTVADEYRLVMVAKGQDGNTIYYPSTHPDGSVYFEWTQKRGSKIKH